MDIAQQQELQKQWLEIQRGITETVNSENEEVSITFNGFVEIISLKIKPDLELDKIEELLTTTLNKGIKSVSQKAQNTFLLFQKQHGIH